MPWDSSLTWRRVRPVVKHPPKPPRNPFVPKKVRR